MPRTEPGSVFRVRRNVGRRIVTILACEAGFAVATCLSRAAYPGKHTGAHAGVLALTNPASRPPFLGRHRQEFLGVIELAGLAMRKSPRVKIVHGVAAVVALVCVGIVYETGEHGGELVYSYAGGIGLRSGNEEDLDRLLLAGYYQKAMADRKAGRSESAAQLIADAARRHSSDPELKLVAAESLLLDQKNPQAAIDALASMDPPAALRIRRGMLQADAFEALGQKDAAIAVLQALVAQTPNARVQQRLDRLKGGAGH